MFTSEDIIGDIVFISFKDPERYNDIGVNSSCGHFMIKGYDNMGIWVSHPGLVVVHGEDEEGKPLPEPKMSKENIEANFLISWDNVKTIMHYPGREGYDFPSEFDKHIGFLNKNK